MEEYENHVKELYSEEKKNFEEAVLLGQANGEFMSFDDFVQAGGFMLADYEEVEETELVENGGAGSGNFGHGGRPGQVGGSGSGDTVSTPKESYAMKEIPNFNLRQEEIDEAVKELGDSYENMSKEDAFKDAMTKNGWTLDGDKAVLNQGIETITEEEAGDAARLYTGHKSKEGMDSLTEGGYRSEFADNADGTYDAPSLYSSLDKSVAITYANDNENNVSACVVNPSAKIIKQSDIRRIREKTKVNRAIPDAIVAAKLGYDIMKSEQVGSEQREMVIMNPLEVKVIKDNK